MTVLAGQLVSIISVGNHLNVMAKVMDRDKNIALLLNAHGTAAIVLM